MITYWRSCIIFSLVVLPFSCSQLQQCPSKVNEEIARCVTPVAQYAEALGMGVQKSDSNGMQPLLPQMGKDVFRELCILIRHFDKCVEEPRKQCRGHITLSLIDASYGYLCNEGQMIFMENANCLMELDRKTVVRLCHDKTLKAIKHANQDVDMSLQEKMQSMCQSLNYFAGCVKGPVESNCGVMAWSVIVRVLRDTTRTLMPGCTFEVQVPEVSDRSTSSIISGNELRESYGGQNSGGFYSTGSGFNAPSLMEFQNESPSVNGKDRKSAGYTNGANRAHNLHFGLLLLVLAYSCYSLLFAYHSVVRWRGTE